MKTKPIFQTSLFLLLALLCSFTTKKQIPSIVKFNQRFVSVDKNLYADKYEVSVKDYQLFLREKKATGADCSLLMYDSTKWRTKLGYAEDKLEYYFNHHAYADYPVVCISHYAANEFCQWLTEKYNASSNKKHKKAVFRLPTALEYKKAAIAHYDSTKIHYPWGNNGLYSKGKKRCNFFELHQEYLDINKKTNALEYKDIFSYNDNDVLSVDYYEANPYGLYNMTGNVSEMIQEEHIAMGGDWLSTGYNVRINSKKKYDEPSRTVGFRVYMEVIEF